MECCLRQLQTDGFAVFQLLDAQTTRNVKECVKGQTLKRQADELQETSTADASCRSGGQRIWFR